jgi:spore maturation protein CgeB
VRLFEAAACGVPIISDDWPGLAEILTPGEEILIAQSAAEVVGLLREMSPERRAGIAAAARARVLASHTAACRAAELEEHVAEVQPARVAMSA